MRVSRAHATTLARALRRGKNRKNIKNELDDLAAARRRASCLFLPILGVLAEQRP